MGCDRCYLESKSTAILVSCAYNISFKWLIARKPWCVAQYGMEKTCEWVKETMRYLYQIYKLT